MSTQGTRPTGERKIESGASLRRSRPQEWPYNSLEQLHSKGYMFHHLRRPSRDADFKQVRKFTDFWHDNPYSPSDARASDLCRREMNTTESGC